MSEKHEKLVPHINQITCVKCAKRMLKQKDHFACVVCGAQRSNELIKIETMFLYLFTEGVRRQNVKSILVTHYGESEAVLTNRLRDPAVFGQVFAKAIATQTSVFSNEIDKSKIQPDLYLEHGVNVDVIRLKEVYSMIDAFVLVNRLIKRISYGFGGKDYFVQSYDGVTE